MLVLIGNTDAEGRMIMADPLCKLREEIIRHKQKSAIPARLFTVATLTGKYYYRIFIAR